MKRWLREALCIFAGILGGLYRKCLFGSFTTPSSRPFRTVRRTVSTTANAVFSLSIPSYLPHGVKSWSGRLQGLLSLVSFAAAGAQDGAGEVAAPDPLIVTEVTGGSPRWAVYIIYGERRRFPYRGEKAHK